MSFLLSQVFEASKTTNYRFNAMATQSKCEVCQGFANLQNGMYARRIRKNHGIPEIPGTRILVPEIPGFLTPICLWNL